ncbi:mitochondrial K+-H+ exchange-related-domain-containing protein [Irpex rosettiformis]|uniref:Mitochondrial K+-H+ exchange-related-domain-containing protein n=1 Tax=Irpex rosettiformis TaxID=378272 RepID=A0ACB8TYJ7_9APHY|nr:mitochondrial K+-H+ exchange-related-domain-containing protein [Irpex rosettiformis]
MSVTNVTKRSLRILALPLVSASKTPGTSSGHLTYYHFTTPPPHPEKTKTWSHWATTKAADIWAGFGKAPEGGWKRRTFVYGERLVDRMDFEEMALKSLDPSLGPSLKRFGHSKADIKPDDNLTIPLIYPSEACGSPISHLRTQLSKRTPKHKRGAWTWLLISPLTAPFMIIPIIPNLPFFFCIWRSWSHYRAYKASSYLEQLLDKGAIVPQSSPVLNAIYAKYAAQVLPAADVQPIKQGDDIDSDASSTPSSDAESPASKPSQHEKHLLLTRDAVQEITAQFDSQPDSTLAANLYRAMEQAALRLQGPEHQSRSK